MKEIPPSRANAHAMRSPETDCMIADTIGIFNSIADFSPLRNFTKGVFNETFAGVHSALEYPGTSRYSLNVREGSSKK